MTGRLRRTVRALLHVDGSPHRKALAFGIGVWIAFFPVLGIHTVMALIIAFAFRLDRVAILAGAYINNPWTLAPLYMAGTVLGCSLLGIPAQDLDPDWEWAGVHRIMTEVRPYLWPFVLGNTVLGIACGLIGYFALRLVLERRREAVTLPPSPQ